MRGADPGRHRSGRHTSLGACVALALLGALAASCDRRPREPTLSEPARWLQDTLRFDTSNPPGNEGPAVEHLAALLRREGVAVEVLTTPSGRASLWAAAGPADAAETLLLLSHLDVVPAGDGWTQPPFGGLLEDG